MEPVYRVCLLDALRDAHAILNQDADWHDDGTVCFPRESIKLLLDDLGAAIMEAEEEIE